MSVYNDLSAAKEIERLESENEKLRELVKWSETCHSKWDYYYEECDDDCPYKGHKCCWVEREKQLHELGIEVDE